MFLMLEIESTHFFKTTDAKFAKIGHVDLKIWIKQFSNLFWKFKSKNRAGYIRSRHLGLSDLTVQLCADRRSGPSDLSNEEGLRSEVPVCISDLFWSMRSRSDGQREKGRGSPGRVDGEVPGVLELHGEGVPAGFNGDGVLDGLQGVAASSETWSTSLMVSCNDGDERLEG
jgi:hypothetical protein